MSDLVIPAPLWRRLASALYDALVLIAIAMVILMAELYLSGVANLPGDVHIRRALLLLAITLYCGTSWTRRRRTSSASASSSTPVGR